MCENIFTVKEATALLKVPESTLLRLLSAKKIEHFKISNKVRISEAHINNYLESVKVSAKTQMSAN